MTIERKTTCHNCHCLVNQLGQYPQTRAMVTYMPEGYQVMLTKELLTVILPEEIRLKIFQEIHEYQELAFDIGDIPHG